jgi:flagellar biosynthetic protein FlhB
VAENSGQERTEKATPKRREQARKKGQVAQSREIPSVLILMTSLGVFFFAGNYLFWNLNDLVTGVYTNLDTFRFESMSDARPFALDIYKQLFRILLPFFVPILVAGIAGNVLQVGFEIHGEALALKFDKLNPVNGVKKLFSLRSLVELGKGIVKIVVVCAVAYGVVSRYLQQFSNLMQQEISGVLLFVGRVSFEICFFVCLALTVLAALDFAYQRWQHEKSLRMTKQEVKDERKQTEGDPKIKARIRRIQMEMAHRRMMAAVPDADVVITNPTHLAIALRFDGRTMTAPRILAKGAGYVAERIRQVAFENDVPIVENKPLAQTLYKIVEIGDEIPVELYRAVAEVLAYVYRLRDGRKTS